MRKIIYVVREKLAIWFIEGKLQWFGATIFPVLLMFFSPFGCGAFHLRLDGFIYSLSLASVFLSIFLLPESLPSRLFAAISIIPFQILVLSTLYLFASCLCTDQCL
jgi:hypothetical protein